MKATFELINQMQFDRIIGKYALAGAVGASFYLEPVSTIDVDIFVDLQATTQSVLLTLNPIYEYLQRQGCNPQGEHILIRGWPVQFLPATTALEKEALDNAVETDYEGVPIRIMTAEHLAAIALQTGRQKDFLRILGFLDENLDIAKLRDILERHNLLRKWQEFRQRFPDEQR